MHFTKYDYIVKLFCEIIIFSQKALPANIRKWFSMRKNTWQNVTLHGICRDATWWLEIWKLHLTNYFDLLHFIPSAVFSDFFFFTLYMIFAIKDHKVASRIIGPLKFLPLNPIVNKFGNIEGCGYNMHQFGLSILIFEKKKNQLKIITNVFDNPTGKSLIKCCLISCQWLKE